MRVVRKMMPEAKNKSTRKDQGNTVDLGTKAPGVCTFYVWGAYAAGMFCCFRCRNGISSRAADVLLVSEENFVA